MKIDRVHIMAAGLFLTGLAAQLGSLRNWSESTQPLFMAGIALNLGSILTAAAAGKLFKE